MLGARRSTTPEPQQGRVHHPRRNRSTPLVARRDAHRAARAAAAPQSGESPSLPAPAAAAPQSGESPLLPAPAAAACPAPDPRHPHARGGARPVCRVYGDHAPPTPAAPRSTDAPGPTSAQVEYGTSSTDPNARCRSPGSCTTRSPATSSAPFAQPSPDSTGGGGGGHSESPDASRPGLGREHRVDPIGKSRSLVGLLAPVAAANATSSSFSASMRTGTLSCWSVRVGGGTSTLSPRMLGPAWYEAAAYSDLRQPLQPREP